MAASEHRHALVSMALSAALAVTVAVALTVPTAAALADPPSWAPAHGWRAKQDGRHPGGKRHYRQPVHASPSRSVITSPPRGSATCDRSLLDGNKTLLGQVLGGVGGAVAGAQFGQGTGQLAATAGGALLGALIGGEVGSSLDAADAACAQQAIATTPTGRTVAWRNPDRDDRYQVTPTRSYRSTDGRYCREYTSSAVIGQQVREVTGTACRQPDGSWRIRN